MKKNAIIAMSGGVDSSVAAFLVQSQGYDCMGVTMKLFNNEDIGEKKEKTCCSLSDVEDARSVANKLGIPYYVFNFSSCFKENVIDRFIAAYSQGKTPNPCIDCNRYLKFEKLFLRAKELDYEFIATGHYAQIDYDKASGRYLLKKSVDEGKDQSYFLYTLTQSQLSHLLLPLGGMKKSQIRKIAQEQGFVNAAKHDSQDICFVPDGKYAEFIRQYTGATPKPGEFRDSSGKVLGTHKGIIHYTIGQRKKLGLSVGKPIYVTALDPKENVVYVGDETELFSKSLKVDSVNWIPFSSLSGSKKLLVKIRSTQKAQPAIIHPINEKEVWVEFLNPQRAITPGQAAVFYEGEMVVGGGIISA